MPVRLITPHFLSTLHCLHCYLSNLYDTDFWKVTAVVLWGVICLCTFVYIDCDEWATPGVTAIPGQPKGGVKQASSTSQTPKIEVKAKGLCPQLSFYTQQNSYFYLILAEARSDVYWTVFTCFMLSLAC